MSHTQRFTNRKGPTCGGSFTPSTSSTREQARAHIHEAGPPLGAYAAVHQVSLVQVFTSGRWCGCLLEHLLHWRTGLPPRPARLAPRSSGSFCWEFRVFVIVPSSTVILGRQESRFRILFQMHSGHVGGFPRVWQLSGAKEAQLGAGEEPFGPTLVELGASSVAQRTWTNSIVLIQSLISIFFKQINVQYKWRDTCGFFVFACFWRGGG